MRVGYFRQIRPDEIGKPACIDDQSEPGSWAEAIAHREAMKRANKHIPGGNPDESENNTDGIRKEHPIHNGRQPNRGAR